MEHISHSLSLSHVDQNNPLPQEPANRRLPADDMGIALRHTGPSGDELKASTLEEKAKVADSAAKQCGVDMAKRSFVAKVLTLVAASAVVVAAALVTGFTGGAGVPLLALAGVGFAMAVSDVACAYKDWQSKKQGGEGFAMGGDALGNAIHWLCKRCDASDEKAKQIANVLSLLTRGALAVGTVAIGGFLPVTTPAALAHTIPAITVGKVSVETVAGVVSAAATRKGAQQHAQALTGRELEGQKKAVDQLQLTLDQVRTQRSEQLRQKFGLQDQLDKTKKTINQQDKALTETRQQLQQVNNNLAAATQESAQFAQQVTNLRGLLEQALRNGLPNQQVPLERRHSFSFA
ncbi:protein EseG [Atlantibacter sp.]|uniref:protein EseG n=1 Tax=Atlantibacter sp. TaxID=1903473 RepID=UPI0028A6B18F|nr:protein EseG [Atlantibacter sp.]